MGKRTLKIANNVTSLARDVIFVVRFGLIDMVDYTRDENLQLIVRFPTFIFILKIRTVLHLFKMFQI
jgi:hypothetical protein